MFRANSTTGAEAVVVVSCCFEPSYPLGVTSGLSGLKETFINETFIKRCIVERINKAVVGPEEQIEKTDQPVSGYIQC